MFVYLIDDSLLRGKKMTIIPAYGRDYNSKRTVLVDWLADKDFVITDFFHPDNGRKINRQDAESAGIRSIMVRYSGLRKITVINFLRGQWK